MGVSNGYESVWRPDEQRVLHATLEEVFEEKLGREAEEVGLLRHVLRREALSDAPAILRLVWAAREDVLEAEQQVAASAGRWRWLWRWLDQLPNPRRAFVLAFVLAFAFGALLLGSFAEQAPPSENSRFLLLELPELLEVMALSVTLGTFVFVLLRFLSRLDDYGSLEGQMVEESLGLATRTYDRILRDAIRSWIRRRIAASRGRMYGTKLDLGDTSGLAEIEEIEREVPTAAKHRLLALIKGMPGGAIGLSGSRGIGKTTLLNSVCDRKAEPVGRDKRRVLPVVVDAPVQYDPREFLLHLFSRVCAEVLEQKRVEELRDWGRFVQPFSGPSRVRQFWLPMGLAIACIGGGSLLLLQPSTPSPRLAGVALLMIGLVIAGTTGSRNLGYLRRLLVGGRRETSDPAQATAELRLRQIWFQQSFSSGWSGSLKASIGVQVGFEGGVELSEQQLSLPDIVDLLRAFLKQLSGTYDVRIGIDELDKMDESTARRFLNEIKVIFRVPGCFFFVSISEEAMSFFERRGLSFRDVFDSSFDEVVQLSHLSFADSKGLLEGRVSNLQLPFACLLHCLSGGLPRDLIRATRDLAELPARTPFVTAAATLCRGAIEKKVRAARVVVRRLSSEDDVTLLNRWCEQLQLADGSSEALLDVDRTFEERFLWRLEPLGDDAELRAERRALQRLGTQLAAYGYFVATLLQLFERFDDKQEVEAAIRPGRGKSAAVDRLATAAQMFSEDVNLAWETLSLLRADLDLDQVPFPVASPSLREPAAGEVAGSS